MYDAASDCELHIYVLSLGFIDLDVTRNSGASVCTVSCNEGRECLRA